MNQPSYLSLYRVGELESRVEIFKNMLSSCTMCPHNCKVNRLKGEKGYCNTLDKAYISSAMPHFGEESELVGNYGSGTIFFSFCNLRCVFCQNYELSYYGEGREVDEFDLAKIMLDLQKKGCHNINLVSPSHIVPQIVGALYLAVQKGLNIPILYNTNCYDSMETLKLLDGIVEIYMPDIKFSDDEIAYKYLGVKNYFKIAKSAMKEMYMQVGNLKVDDNNIAYRGILIRHLVMPENLAGTEKIMKFISEEISPDAYINIMNQYYPANKAYEYAEINRRITQEEFSMAVRAAKSAGLNNVHVF